jgi:3-hydroxybutyryl-CoA dehydratase
MSTQIEYSDKDSFVVEGKLALPYKYFAGRTGSKFIIGLRDQKKILGTRCKKCNKVYVPPRLTCEKHVTEKCDEWVELPGTGTVANFTVVRYAEPHQPVKPPYIVALIKLDGADCALAHIVKGAAPSEMRVGMKVKPIFAKESTSTITEIDHFAPAAPKPAFEMGKSYDELELGMSASFSKTITETDVYLFAGISGDFNPMHVNEEFAKTTPFGKRIAHGALPQCLIAPVFGMKLPGLGTIALEVNIRYKAPTYFGDTITATATVAEKLEEKKRIKMNCEWTNQDGKVVASGWAILIPPPKM